MIEKIIKMVKSSNKKRGKNISIGTVVGLLLSCTTIMGKDSSIGLKITQNNGKIELSSEIADNTLDIDKNIYTNNTIIVCKNDFGNACGIKISADNKISIINNGIISGIGKGTSNNLGFQIYGSGIYTSERTTTDIINNGVILGSTSSHDSFKKYYYYGSGIYNFKGTINNIKNQGIISGINLDPYYTYYSSYGSGIYNSKGNIKNIKNQGIISGTSSGPSIYSHGFGIYNDLEESNSINNIANQGIISGSTSGSSSLITSSETLAYGSGIYNSKGIINSITNHGTISGVNSGSYSSSFGIYNSQGTINDVMNQGIILGISSSSSSYGSGIYNSEGKINTIANQGIITGIGLKKSSLNGYGIKSNASSIKINNLGIIHGTVNAISVSDIRMNSKETNNYGILVTEGETIILGAGTENNYGLYISGKDGIVTLGTNGKNYKDFFITNGDKERNLSIKNAELDGESGKTTSTKSIVLGTNDYDNHILNGKNDTLKISEEDKKINGSIINAYGTAIAFDTEGGELTLSGTIINGGIDRTSNAVMGSGNADILILHSGTIVYTNGTGMQNTIINGNVNMGDGNDVLTIGAGSIINGTLTGGEGEDILNFGRVEGLDTEKNINILHDISEFENININKNTNVTLFEKTIGNDGKRENLEVSGVNEINISAGGVLNLRINSTVKNNGRYVGHALFGNENLKINGDISQIKENTVIVETEGGVYNVGVFNLVTNGLGKDSIIGMDGITLNDNLFVKTNSILDKATILENVTEGEVGKIGDIKIEAEKDIFGIIISDDDPKDEDTQKYIKLNEIYNGVYTSTGENFNTLKDILTLNEAGKDYTSVTDEEQLKALLSYLGSIYTESPYSHSSELSRQSAGMFRDIITENHFIPNLNKWMIMGGLTHKDGGTKDTYYGKNYHGFDTGTADTDVDIKLTGAYMLGKYGYNENITLGVTVGGNRSEAELSMSKIKGNSGYIGVFTENYKGNLTLKAGAGIQYSEYDADRRTIGGYNYSEKYSDMTYDIYLNGRYSHNIGDNLFLEPYGTLSYTYTDQEGTDEGNKALAIETDSKSFEYISAKVGVDIKKVISHEKGKSTLSAGVSYTKIINGADEEHITGRFKGGEDFDILVAHKNEHSIGLNAKYALELENGILFDVKGSYFAEKESHNDSGKNKTKGEWLVGLGLGYKF